VRDGCDLPDAEDIVQETFIRAWRLLPQLSSGDFPVRPWLYRVARNLLIDADRAARSRPVTVRAQPAEEGRDDTGLNRVLDQQLVTDALHQLSPAHRTVLVETFYRGHSLARVARQLGIPDGTARSRLHYALRALRRQLDDPEAVGSRWTRHRSGHMPAVAGGAAGPAATRWPIRRVTAVMLLAAAALDLTRCGLVAATATHCGASGRAGVGRPSRCPLGIAAHSVESVIILLVLLVILGAWQARIHAASAAAARRPAVRRLPEYGQAG